MKLSSVSGVLSVTVALGLPLYAAATPLIVPVSQTRSVSASAQISGGPLSSSSFSVSDFDPWSQGASASSVHPAGPGWYVSNGVEQTSTIGEDRLSAHVEASFGWAFGAPGGTAQTQSLFDVTFDLLEPANYQLGNGQVSHQFGCCTYGSHLVRLQDENDQVIAQPPWNYYYPPGSDDLLAWMSVSSGVLAPGRYRLTAEWNGGFMGDSGSWVAAAVMLFTPIPEPGTALLLASGLGAITARRRRSES